MPRGSNNQPGVSVHMDEHRMDATIENVLFMMGTGVSIDLICERLGKKKDTLDATFRRRGKQPPWARPKEKHDVYSAG